MAKTIAHFRGSEEVIGNLTRYEKTVRNKHLRIGLEAGAEIVREDAERRAPVDTGLLRESMLAIWDGRRRHVKVGPSARAFYGVFQEFGTSRMAAQPFLRPALDANEEQVFGAIASELEKAGDWLERRRL